MNEKSVEKYKRVKRVNIFNEQRDAAQGDKQSEWMAATEENTQE